MFDPSDYYGNQYKWFVGKVKDVNDPLNSNRVRVNIFGIHPDEELIDGLNDGGTTGTPPDTFSNIPPSSLTNIPPATGASLIPIDKTTLPNPSQMNAKISKYFTLGQLTVNACGGQSGSSCRANLHLLSQDIIYNLSNLATNCLDPIKEQFGNLSITSGWRIGIGSTENHPKGFAADIQVGGSSNFDAANWISQNLRGRFSLLILEYQGSAQWVHIQLGSSGARNQGSAAQPLIQTSLNGRYSAGLTHVA
jgi:hypothetical protein